MLIHSKNVNVYDIEVFPNVFHCCVKDTENNQLYKFEISERKNQLLELVNFFYFENKDRMFCGYNNKHYDDVVINYMIDYSKTLSTLPYNVICNSLFNLSQTIVRSEESDISKFKKWKYAKYFYSMDLLTMQFSQKLRVGLKTMQVTMHYKNVQEYDGDFNKPLPKDSIDEMIDYNINDVESTTELLHRLEKKGEIELRLYIQEEYGIDCLSFDGTKIGETILEREYCKTAGISSINHLKGGSPMDYIDLKDVILPEIAYKNPMLQDVLKDMKSSTVYSKERKGYEKKFVLSNTCYSIGVGGIHSKNTPRIYRPKEGEYIGHSDVTSMYPSLLIQHKFGPRLLGKDFLVAYSNIYKERVEAKHTGQKLKDTVLKLALNAVTGKMQQEVSWLYDPFSVFKIRINGQLILLMLVDRLLELGCEIIQVNTDGVMYIAKKAVKEQIQNAITEVEQLTKLTFENDVYEEFYQYAVNDYFGIRKGYSETHDPELIERKGMFITKTKLGKGLSPVIIPKAVINYFLTKQPVDEYIRNCTDIREFLISQAVDKKFKVLYGDEPVQRINRFYASENGRYLYKYDPNDKTREKTCLLTRSGVTILNTLNDLHIEDRKINYRYYISEANKIINDFTCQQLELF